MLSRRTRTLLCVLIAAQAFLSAPVVAAMTSGAERAGASSMPCADMMPGMSDGERCPCCPDGVENAAGCLSACTASLGAIPSLGLPASSTSRVESIASSTVRIATLADPPLKPPPIR